MIETTMNQNPWQSTFGAIHTFAQNIARNSERLVLDVVRDSGDIQLQAAKLAEAATRKYLESKGLAAQYRDTFPRIVRIVQVCSLQVLTYKKMQLTDVFKPVTTEDWEKFHSDCAQALLDLCLELEGGVLKAGQFLSCQENLLPDAYANTLHPLQNFAPVCAFDALLPVLEKELGENWTDRLKIDETPIASASIAQVHKGEWDGQTVAVKIRKPGIEALVRADKIALQVVARIVDALIPNMNLSQSVEHLCLSLEEELDFETEAANIRRFSEFESHHCGFPNVCESTDSILILDFIEGQKITDALSSATQNEQKDMLVAILQSFLHQLFDEGFLHCDPHPGNILADKDANVFLIDWGAAQEISESQRKGYIKLVLAAFTSNKTEVIQTMRDLGFRTHSDSDESYWIYARQLVQQAQNAQSSQFDVQALRSQTNAILAQNIQDPMVELPRDFVQIGRALASLSSLVLTHQPEIDYTELFKPYLLRAMM